MWEMPVRRIPRRTSNNFEQQHRPEWRSNSMHTFNVLNIYRSNRAIEQKHQKGTDRREEKKKTSENRAEGRFREPNNRSCYTQYVYLFIGFSSDADAPEVGQLI